MPKCTVCSHPQKEMINREIIEGASLRSVAQQFGVSYSAVNRHKADHLPMKMTMAKLAEETADADNLLAKVRDLQRKACDLLAKAEQAGDLRTALQGVREARGCLELLAKLQGQLQQEGTVNITFVPRWLELRAVILQALEPYPEAKICLSKALQEQEADTNVNAPK